ncbi:oxidoreductase [Actinocatenispora thailandica]|uniref:Oxidoreductase n=1 Tax=Actinocatenispora thailandica TaxID=227318 RepID=A0A7R7HXF5_9ACTN|nr:oxidoreductase [Actinocatenispora thailandica]BCJ36127.1 oxidoreductase [Actinocatenispora thailandica]
MTNDFLLGGDTPVRRVGLGAMRLVARGHQGPAVPTEDALATLRSAVELGIDHLDTADFYRYRTATANQLIRTALRPYPAGLVLATKVGPVATPAGPPRQGTAADLVPSVTANLRSLGVDRLDLVYLRIGGIDGPPDESIEERFTILARLREEGLIRHLGLSNVSAGHLAEARRIAPVAAVQNRYGWGDTGDDALLAECAAAGIGYVPFFPLGGGRRPLADPALRKVARRHGVAVATVALAWLLDRSATVLAIPGTASPAHLAENVAAAGLALSDADRAELGTPATAAR